MLGLEETAARSVRAAVVRALLLALWMMAFELVVRTVYGAASFPDATTAAAAALAHGGRVAIVVPFLVLVDLVVTAVASTSKGAKLGAHVARALARLTSPWRVARLVGVTAIAWVVLSRTVGRHYQLAWHAGATYAPAVTFACALLELAVARLRREPPPARVHPLGALACIISVSLFATLVVTLTVDLPTRADKPGTMLVVFVLFVITRAAIPPVRLGTLPLLGALVIATLLVVFDVRRPELRRFDSQLTPFSVLGRTTLARLTDLDGDGLSAVAGLDCDDLDASISPLATEIPDDGVDQNCRAGDAHSAKAVSQLEPPSASAASPPRTRPPVFFISIDAWRADSFDAKTFPETSRWAEACFEFTSARSSASYTGPSMVALNMGVYARHVRADDGRVAIRLAELSTGRMSRPPSLAAALTLAGHYWTSVVFPPFFGGNLDFLTGHAVVRVLPSTDAAFYPPASDMFAVARAAMAEARPGLPLFLRVHLMDLHAPYTGGTDRASYLGSARALDHELAGFLRSLPKDAVVVLTGDHGEGFWEHGYTQHGRSLFEEEIRVPLVVCAPGFERPRKIGAPVSLVDVAPTILDIVGVSVAYRWHGESLTGLLRGDTTRQRTWVYAENVNLGQKALVLGCDKWMEDARSGWTALFDVCADPGERRDLARVDPERARRMRDRLGEILDLDLDMFRTTRIGSRPWPLAP